MSWFDYFTGSKISTSSSINNNQCFTYKDSKWISKYINQDDIPRLVSNYHQGIALGTGGRHSSDDKLIGPKSKVDGGTDFVAAQGQDRLVLEILGNMTDGYYIDLGARWWHRSSNTFILDYIYDWQGLCIEPDPIFYPGLIMNRTCTVICDNPIGISTGGSLSFSYRMGRRGDERLKPDIILTVVSLEDIFKKFKVPKQIDYLSIDIDGMESKALMQFPLKQYQFKIISIERPSMLMHNILSRNNYWFMSRIGGQNHGECIYINSNLSNFEILMDKYRKTTSVKWHRADHPYLLKPKWRTDGKIPQISFKLNSQSTMKIGGGGAGNNKHGRRLLGNEDQNSIIIRLIILTVLIILFTKIRI